MKSSGRVFVVTAGALFFATSGWTQSVDLIEAELNGIRRGTFELGPFYVTPAVRLSSGYDSNALSSPSPESDVTARVGPAVRAAAPFGSLAFFEIDQEIDYVYYREQVDLRRWFNITNLGAGFGGRRFLVRVNDMFRDETGRPTSEFDFPVRQRSNQLDASVSLALGWRQQLRLVYGQSRYTIEDGLDDELIRGRLNRVQDRYALELRRTVSAKTAAVAEGFYERNEFDDLTRDGESSGARFGLEFNPGSGDPLGSTPWGRSFVSGRFLLGFRSVMPFDAALVDYTGLIGSVDVTFGFGGGHGVQTVYRRDIVPSIFQENWYFIENRWGASVRFQVMDRLSVTPGVSIGKNDYPLPVDEEELSDDHRTYRLGVDYRIAEHWSVGVSMDYLERTSNVVLFGKERLQIGFNMAFQP